MVISDIQRPHSTHTHTLHKLFIETRFPFLLFLLGQTHTILKKRWMNEWIKILVSVGLFFLCLKKKKGALSFLCDWIRHEFSERFFLFLFYYYYPILNTNRPLLLCAIKIQILIPIWDTKINSFFSVRIVLCIRLRLANERQCLLLINIIHLVSER